MGVVLSVLGFYYVMTGLWPVVHIRSFQMITGPKVDKWLVKMVGLLAFCSGVVFLYSSIGSAIIPAEIVLLAVLNILAFMMIDIWYILRKIISPIYLVDAVIQGIFLIIVCYLSTET